MLQIRLNEAGVPHLTHEELMYLLDCRTYYKSTPKAAYYISIKKQANIQNLKKSDIIIKRFQLGGTL